MYTINKNFPITAAGPIPHIEAANGTNGAGSALGKQWVAKQLGIPAEAAHDSTLLAYVGEHSWCILAAYASDVE
jgi:hypothetical protein